MSFQHRFEFSADNDTPSPFFLEQTAPITPPLDKSSSPLPLSSPPPLPRVAFTANLQLSSCLKGDAECGNGIPQDTRGAFGGYKMGEEEEGEKGEKGKEENTGGER